MTWRGALILALALNVAVGAGADPAVALAAAPSRTRAPLSHQAGGATSTGSVRSPAGPSSSPAGPSSSPAGPVSSPAGPALTSGASAYATPAQPTGESEPESAAGSEDPLVRNGLRSPFCGIAAAQLPGALADNCHTSGFLAAAAPSEDYSFDTNIDTTLGVSVDALLQDYLVRPIWMGLIWLAHGLLVALEWSYALDLVRGPLANGLAPLLRDAQSRLTDPWLASLLALASVLAAYHGLIRRRVAQTLGEAAAMLAMIAAAMFVIADPSATVGALSQWSDEASLGSLDAIADGGSAQPYAAFALSMQQLYAATIQAPWCFLEFGDVSWCDSPGRLDPRLRAAAMRISARIAAEAAGPAGDRGDRGMGAEVLTHRVQLLRQAQSNGAIFLALPANGPLRNSVKDPGSLLYVLCGGAPDATRCKGPTAAEAEFRANSGTLPRIGGVVVIALGVLGMLLLVGFVALRLLEAAVISVLFLVLAPAAALAPTLGDAGRAAFKRWAGRLLGAATAKLLWSMVLAALLTTMRLLLALQGIGWLTQWLLMGALWWGLFLRRHGLLATISHGHRPGGRVPRAGRLVEDAAIVNGRWAARRARDRWRARKSKGDEPRPRPAAERGRRSARDMPSSALKVEGVQPRHVQAEMASTLPSEWEPGFAARWGLTGESNLAGDPGTPQEPPGEAATLGARLLSLRQAHADAVEAGDMRRAVSLASREKRVERRYERATNKAATPSPTCAKKATPREAPPLDVGMPRGSGRRRSGSDLDRTHQSRPHAAAEGTPTAGQRAAEARREGSTSGAPGGSTRIARNTLDQDLRARRQQQTQPSNPIMRDALEVAQGRKRQLGWGKEEDD